MPSPLQFAAHPRRTDLPRMLGAGLLALAAVAAMPAWAQSPAQGPGMGRPPPGGPGMMMLGDPMQINRMLDEVNATDAQRTQIKQIVSTAAADMKAQHGAARALREQGLQILAAPAVDAGAAEALRQQMVAQQDANSKRMLQTMLEVANVLTPEQRVMLVDRMRQREVAMHDRMPRAQRRALPPDPKS